MKRGKGNIKGSAWERAIATRLSEWWSEGKDSDMFWRTHSSGARATLKFKKGKVLKSQIGDITSTDSRGAFLLKCFTISLKRGYPRVSLQDLVDTLEKGSEAAIGGWIRECEDHSVQAKSVGWLLIIRKDRRQALIIMPGYMLLNMDRYLTVCLSKISPHVKILAKIQQYPTPTPKQLKQMTRKKARIAKRRSKRKRVMSLYCTTLEKFLSAMSKKDVVRIVKKHYYSSN
jgi:hypothetical protein